MAKEPATHTHHGIHIALMALLLVCAALLIAVLDPIYAAVTGEVLEILGLRLSLLAGILLLLALGAAVRELILEHEAK